MPRRVTAWGVAGGCMRNSITIPLPRPGSSRRSTPGSCSSHFLMRNNSGIALGVTMNWVALVANGLVSFFLTPFVVHRLGNAWYGVWILINSAIAYMATLDLGLRGAVVHFIAKHHAQGDHEASSHTLSAALVIRILMSSLVTVATVLLALFLGRILRIPPELEGAARPALLATGISFAFTLTSGVFGAVLAALQRFDVLAGISMAQSFATVLGAVWLWDRRAGHPAACDRAGFHRGTGCSRVCRISGIADPADAAVRRDDPEAVELQLLPVCHQHRRPSDLLYGQPGGRRFPIGGRGNVLCHRRPPDRIPPAARRRPGANADAGCQQPRCPRRSRRNAPPPGAGHARIDAGLLAHRNRVVHPRRNLHRAVDRPAIRANFGGHPADSSAIEFLYRGQPGQRESHFRDWQAQGIRHLAVRRSGGESRAQHYPGAADGYHGRCMGHGNPQLRHAGRVMAGLHLPRGEVRPSRLPVAGMGKDGDRDDPVHGRMPVDRAASRSRAHLLAVPAGRGASSRPVRGRRHRVLAGCPEGVADSYGREALPPGKRGQRNGEGSLRGRIGDGSCLQTR